ncbi:MAG: TonB-dependent receptor [Bacteroidota bacterium]|nr:TonB-dependent receptor [Bacteroidota bacterium]
MRRFYYILTLIFCSQLLFGQSKGTITGTIVDKSSGTSLPSVNVIIKGTYYGAASDIEGKFKITNISPGSYTIEVSIIGYKAMQYTGVKVNADETTTLNVKMEETVLTLGQEVVIVGEKPLFNIEETASRRSISGEDIQLAVVKDVKDVVSLQTGVVQSDNEIHIRGGRSYENAYLIDGISVQDPLAGQGFGLQIAPQAIAEVEVLTGGYNAEYGQATSGVVNITTKEGQKKYAGSVGHKRDHFGVNNNSISNFNTDIYEFNLSGPEPITSYLSPTLGLNIPGSVSFFTNIYANLTDGYTRWVEKLEDGRPVGYEALAPKGLYSTTFGGKKYSPRRSNSYSGLMKLTYKPEATMKLSYGFSQSVQIDQNTQTVQATLDRVEPNPGYQFLFQKIPDNANTFTQINKQHSLSWTHTLNPKTFYEIKMSLYTARVRGDANKEPIDPARPFDEYQEPKDIVTYPVEYFFPDPNSRDTIFVIPGDGFYEYGNPTTWRDHYLREFTFKFDLSSTPTEQHKLKAGIETRFQEMQLIDIIQPWIKPLGFDNDIYSVYPAFGAIYGQDGVTLSGMILNFGLRLDYWLPGKYVDDAIENGSARLVPIALQEQYKNDSYKWFGRYWKARLSPRLGISHPVTDNQTLFFSYGHFSKLPRPQFVYSKLSGTKSRSSFQTIGNPNLNPETTVAYELGLRNQLTENDVFTLTAFYKDIFDYITAKQFRAIISGTTRGVYTIYINQDYARVRGIELEYKTRFGKMLRATLSGSYNIATGKSSAANENVYNIQQGLEENLKENYVIWDRPWQGSANLNFNVAKNEPLFGFGKGILDDYNLYVRLFYQSGKRYTPQIFYRFNPTSGRPEYQSDRANPYSKVGSDWFYINLNFEKYITFGFAKLVVTMEIQNLLNNKNSQILNPITGEAYEYGQTTPVSWNDPLYPDLTAPIDPFPYNPARYLNPRTFNLGLSLRF